MIEKGKPQGYTKYILLTPNGALTPTYPPVYDQGKRQLQSHSWMTMLSFEIWYPYIHANPIHLKALWGKSSWVFFLFICLFIYNYLLFVLFCFVCKEYVHMICKKQTKKKLKSPRPAAFFFLLFFFFLFPLPPSPPGRVEKNFATMENKKN